jgi:glucose/arabinose dehydrogenase
MKKREIMKSNWKGCLPLGLMGLISFIAQIDLAITQASEPAMLVPGLAVRTVVSGLVTPTTTAFPGPNEMFVLEKNTGKVQHVVNGAVQGTVLDLAVNFSSERGLLGIALDPKFSDNHFVYLYWTCRAPAPDDPDPIFPTELECPDQPDLGADTDDLLAVPLLANRVDRFHWDGAALTFNQNLIKLRAFQNDGVPIPPDQGDEDQPPRGNHNAGVIAFGPDGKLHIIIGDEGRRGALQNLPSGPTETGLGPVVDDDQFGGPEPDRAHLSGVILRLNPDGTAPADNPFYNVGATMGGEVGENLQKIFAYGLRNSFGLTFDPLSGNLWESENGEDAFDELNRIERGMNGGWIQIMGPLVRVPEFKEIETTSLHGETFPNLQQLRWGPERIADTPEEALSRLFVLPGSHYKDPEFSWKFVIAPAAIGFLNSRALGPQYYGDLFVGQSVTVPMGGVLLHFNLTGNRKKIAVDNAGLEDRVDDNGDFFTFSESADAVIGTGFGIVTDIRTAPNGNLYVTSLSQGAVYEVFRNR